MNENNENRHYVYNWWPVFPVIMEMMGVNFYYSL